MSERPPMSWATYWGVLGFCALLVQAIVRLTPVAWEPIAEGGLSNLEIAFYAISILFNGYSEGYRAFQLQVAPRVVVRGIYLATHQSVHAKILAPIFCMALIHATRRRLIVSWTIFLGIVALIVMVRQLDQPWRGIVDAGVVVGLTWGLISILVVFAQAIAGHPPSASPEVPESENSPT